MKSYNETILEIEEQIKTKYLDRYPGSKYIIRFQKTDSPVAIVILTIIIFIFGWNIYAKFFFYIFSYLSDLPVFQKIYSFINIA